MDGYEKHTIIQRSKLEYRLNRPIKVFARPTPICKKAGARPAFR
jgi:hypothetical protein